MSAQHTPGPWRVSGKATINAGRSWIASVSTTQAMLVVRLLCFKLDQRTNYEAHGAVSVDHHQWGYLQV
jgi:hypothetical protein